MAEWSLISDRLNRDGRKPMVAPDEGPDVETRVMAERQARVGKDINRCPVRGKLAFEGAGPRVRYYSNNGTDW